MNKPALLEIVQSTLGSLDSDAVSTIGETIESEQIAMIAKEQYYKIATYQHVPQFESLTQLVDLSDSTKATVMKIPENSIHIKNVRYRKTTDGGASYFEDIEYIERDDFLRSVLLLDVNSTEVGENVLDGNVRVPYRNDQDPTCWTTFDDEHLIFDAIKTGPGVQTMTNDNSLVIAYVIPEFLLTDDFIPDLPLSVYSQYMDQIKETASHEQKQTPSDVRTRDGERQQHRNRISINDYNSSFKARATEGSHGRGQGRQKISYRRYYKTNN